MTFYTRRKEHCSLPISHFSKGPVKGVLQVFKTTKVMACSAVAVRDFGKVGGE